ncbi:hypothetical protein [Aquimarina sediminis]|uniref:hypothetical protein n=1 Tax=Aquimarina sediminis TaxID=2070536 RepID=UPI000CA0423D|nr:hypothetical protein [Aquimarina sediminis]
MNNEFDELQRKWQKNKESINSDTQVIDETLSSIIVKKNSSIRFHYNNIIILSIVLVGIAAFFYYIAPVKELLSRIGVGLMLGGLLIRIIIELISVLKSKKMNVVDDVLKSTNDAIDFYKFRKRIHGPITITIIVLYTIGFYMITPEFSLYFTKWQMILINTSYIIGALVPLLFVRKIIKKEIQTLLEIVNLKNKIIEEKS